MAYADKCCGVCGDYQNLRFCSDGKLYNDNYEGREHEECYRFYCANVCLNCVSNKSLWHVPAKDIKFEKSEHKSHRTLRQKKDWFWVEVGEKWVARHMDEWRAGYGDAKSGRGSPWLLYCEHHDMSGTVYHEDKRRLRKILRKLGVKGNLSRVIK